MGKSKKAKRKNKQTKQAKKKKAANTLKGLKHFIVKANTASTLNNQTTVQELLSQRGKNTKDAKKGKNKQNQQRCIAVVSHDIQTLE